MPAQWIGGDVDFGSTEADRRGRGAAYPHHSRWQMEGAPGSLCVLEVYPSRSCKDGM